MLRRRIPVARPIVGFRSGIAVINALLHREISGYSQQYVPKFELDLAKYVGTNYAVAVNSGTSAINLALVSLGITTGDKVAVASYTNMATFFPVLQLGAVPIPIDIEYSSWNLDPDDLELVLTENSGIKAIIVVHIFGHPANMQRIMQIANSHKIPVIEDCAEALGCTHYGQKIGSIGTIGCHSFYANKMITTGEGGALTTNERTLANRAIEYRSLSFGKKYKFIHTADGYNFRMSNLQAALGVYQLRKIERRVRQKRRIANYYSRLLSSERRIETPRELAHNRNVFWMYHIRIKGLTFASRETLIRRLDKSGIEVREGFASYSKQTTVLKMWGQEGVRATPVTDMISQECLYLPSGPRISKRKMRYVINQLSVALDELLQT